MATQDFIYVTTFYEQIFNVYLNTNSKKLYSEDVCNQISRALGFKTKSFFMFALYLPSKNIFLPPSFNLVNSNNNLKLDLNVKINYRLRFLPASIPQLMENDSSAFNYLFHQIRYDFINSRIPNINLLKLSDSLGLVVADVCRMTLNQSSNNFNESIDSTQKDSPKNSPLLHDDLANVPVSNNSNQLLRSKLKSSALLLNHLETYVPNDYLNSARDRIRFAVSGRRALRRAVKESLLAPKMPSKFFYEMKYLETLLPLPTYNNESYDCSISGHALLQMSRDITGSPFVGQSTMERTVANSCVPGRICLNLPTPPIAHGNRNSKESKYEYCLMFQPLSSALKSGTSLRRRRVPKRKSLRKQNFVLNRKKASSQSKSILRATNSKGLSNDAKNICEKNGILICALSELSFISIHSETVAEISRKTGIPLTVTFNTNLAMLSFISLLDGYYRLSQRFSFNLCTLVYSPTLLKLKSLASHGPVGDEFVELKFREKLQQAMAQTGCQIKSLTGSYLLRQSAYSYNRFLLDVLFIEDRDQTAHHDIQYRIQTFVIQENYNDEPIQLLNSIETSTYVIKTNQTDFNYPSSPQNPMIKLLQIPQSNAYWTFLGEKHDNVNDNKFLPYQQHMSIRYANLRALLKAYSNDGGEEEGIPFTYPAKCIPPSDYDLAPELLLCNRYLFDLSEKTNYRTKSLTFNSDERLAQYATLQIALKQILDPAGLIGNNSFSAGNSLNHSGNGNENNEFEPSIINQSHKNSLVGCDNYQQYQLIKAAPLLFIAFADLELFFSFSSHDNKHKQKFCNKPQQHLVETKPPITMQNSHLNDKTGHSNFNDKSDKVLETLNPNPDLNNKVEYHDVLSSEEMYNSLSSRPTINRTPNLFSGQTLMTKKLRLIDGEFNTCNTLNGRSSLMASGIWHRDKYYKIPISFKTIITSSLNKTRPIDSEEMTTVTFLKALNKFAFISDPTLVKIYGVCLDPLLIITEELELGSWATFLRSSAAAVKEERVDVCCILEAGATISRALWFLHEKALTHNRIGAVNVYVKLKKRTPTEPNHKFEDNCHQDLERAFPENWTVKLCDPVLSINPFEAYCTNFTSQPANLTNGFGSLDEGLNKLYAICPHHALFKLPWLSPELFCCSENDGGTATKHNQYLTDKLPSLLKNSIINKQINPISILDSISNDEGYDIWSFGTFLWESLMYASVNPLSALCLSGSSQFSIKSAYRNLLNSLQKTTDDNSIINPKDNPGVSDDVVNISLGGTENNSSKNVFETKIEKEANMLLSVLLSNIIHHEVRLPKPTNCPDRLYSLLLQCWQRDKDHRIRIHELVRDTHQIFYSLLHTREKRKQFSQLQLKTKAQHSDQTNPPTLEKTLFKSNTISNGQISHPSNFRVPQHVRINHHCFSNNSKSKLPNVNKSEHTILDSAVPALKPLNENSSVKQTPFKNQASEIGIGSDGYVDHETLKSPLSTFHECRLNESLYLPTDVESLYSITLNEDINDTDKPNDMVVNSNTKTKPTLNNFNDTLKRRPFDPQSLQYDMSCTNTNSPNIDTKNVTHESASLRQLENKEKNDFSTIAPHVNGHIYSMTMNNLVSVEEEGRLNKDSFELKSHITRTPLPPVPQKMRKIPAPLKKNPRFPRSNKIWRQFRQHILSTILKRHSQRDTSSQRKNVLMASDGKSYIRLLPQDASSPSSTLGDIKETTKPKWLLRKKFRFRSNSYSGLTCIGHPHSQTYLLGNSNYNNNPYYYSYNNFGNCFEHVPMIPQISATIGNDSHMNGLRRSSSSYTISLSINNQQNDKNSAYAFTISETQIRYIKSLGEMNKNGDDTWLAIWTKFNDLFCQKVVIKQFNIQQSPPFVNNFNDNNREITSFKSQSIQKNYALLSPLFQVILPKLILNPHPNIAHIKGILSFHDENDVLPSDSYKKEERMPISYTTSNNMLNNANNLVTIKQKYVMEYLEMGTLSNYLQMNGPDITLRQKMIYMKDIARGMAFLYDELGIVHGDLKACHILMTNEGKTVKIAHFGRKCRNAMQSNDCIDKSNKGQPNDENDIVLSDLAWMAPELFKDRNAISTKSDVWSFGSVCWEILTNSSISLSQAMFSILQSSLEMQNSKSSRTLNDKPRHSYINEEILTPSQTKSIISQYYNDLINGSDHNNPKIQSALPLSNKEQVIVLMEQLIKDGWRLPLPEFCPSYLGEYIKDTLWTFNQHSRPFFHQILQKFSLLLQPNI